MGCLVGCRVGMGVGTGVGHLVGLGVLELEEGDSEGPIEETIL